MMKLFRDPRINEYKKTETRTDRFLDRHCSRPVTDGKAASDAQYMSPMLTAFARR